MCRKVNNDKAAQKKINNNYLTLRPAGEWIIQKLATAIAKKNNSFKKWFLMENYRPTTRTKKYEFLLIFSKYYRGILSLENYYHLDWVKVVSGSSVVVPSSGYELTHRICLINFPDTSQRDIKSRLFIAEIYIAKYYIMSV